MNKKIKESFIPFVGYVEVEPISKDSPFLSESKDLIECATVVGKIPDSDFSPNFGQIEIGDVIFFRPHGFFELSEFQGKKRYVVRVHEDFILGIQKNVAKK